MTSNAPAPPEQPQPPAVSAVRGLVSVRVHRFVERLVEVLPAEAAARVGSAATDLEVLTALLEAAPYVAPAPDPRAAAAYARGRAAKQALLRAEGGVLGCEDMANRVGRSRQALEKQRRSGRVLAVRDGGAWLYPVWQFGSNGERLDGLGEVLEELTAREHGAWTQLVFFIDGETAKEGESPLDALRAGRVEAALEAARVYGEHGAK